jgi:GNAT superfamily N-acetyltransferase
MKMDADIAIRRGVPEQHRHRAAEIYYEAFCRKLSPLIGSARHGIAIIARALQPDLALVAMSRDEIVGLAGLAYGGRRFLNWQRADFTREFGWLRGSIKMLATRFDHQPDRKGELLLDAIAVAGTARGNGIGTLLLEAVFTFARENGFGAVRLEVVDTNPDARRLYERLGFIPMHTHHYPFLRPIVGVSAVTTMVKRIT